jgi:7,8-dihydroneopterin aldolase/epimerase/oxygenase
VFSVSASQHLHSLIQIGGNRPSTQITLFKDPLMHSKRLLKLSGLKFQATLGILESELETPQTIRVDAELNLGLQLNFPGEDDIGNVLDYRAVRQIILEKCQEVHVNLLESMTGKLLTHLQTLPSVLGVKVRITKLEIFDDCEVSIAMETGTW